MGIVPILLVIAAFFGVEACSHGHGNRKKRHQESGEGHASDRAEYRRACINDSSCPVTEQRDAFYDYVEAVYGKADGARFDGVLIAGERSYVLRTFGSLTAPDRKEAYLTNARRAFLRGGGFLQAAPDCEREALPGQALLDRTRNIIIKSSLACYRDLGDVELFIASDPSEWVFFVDRLNLQEFMPYEETAVFSRIAGTLDIPIFDPLLPPWDSKVSEEMADTYDITPVKSASAFLFLACGDRAVRFSDRETDCFHLPENFLEKGARYFGLPLEALRSAYLRFVGPPPTSTEEMDLTRQNREARSWLRRYLLESLALSPAFIRRSISQTGRSRTLVQLRPESQPLLEEIDFQ